MIQGFRARWAAKPPYLSQEWHFCLTRSNLTVERIKDWLRVPTPLDKLDEEIVEGAASPVSGVGAAVTAGEAFAAQTRLGGWRPVVELPAYLFVQLSWFTAFGLQTVLFPYMLKNVLDVNGAMLGLGQMALAAPSVGFILLGGVVAERADGRALLVLFHILACLPSALLAYALRTDALFYWMLLSYAVAMGTIGAFMMPARDAILNEVVDRRQKSGSRMTLQQGVAFATLAQFAAQIVGLILGGFATSRGVWPLLALQSSVMAVGALAALFLARGQMVRTGRTGIGAVFGDIADGMRCVVGNPVLLSMVLSMFAVGVFVIGAFLVVLPIINADVYGGDSDGLRNIFVTFWAGAFCSSMAISRFRNVSHPGRLLLTAQAIGSAGILFMVGGAPYWAFLTLVFVWGLAAGVSIMMSRSIVQSAAPTHLLARVLSIYQLGFMGGAPIGAAVLGVVSDQIGPDLVILVPSIGMLVMITAMIVFTPIWNLRTQI
jgi:MFS family permease